MVLFLTSLGVYAVLFAIQFGYGVYETSTQERRGISVLRAAGIDPKDNEAVRAFLIKRVDPDRFGNRLADFIGYIWNVITWISSIVVGLVFLYQIYNVFISGDSSSDIAFIGCAVWSVFMFMVGIVVNLLCKLLTGRYPSEPKKIRKRFIENDIH
ncbi:hypothetical protein [Kosakonia sp. MUSA4]|uniref:hypothetical protein n=1 Tax=Kosakonia sp. MUSA4 TaxID=2067958 RepID=UPI00159A6529|nr:hypothetical protein [Kosakonia sp. MUSA4]QJT80874.1 hypothetical protein C0557_12695 [Kosakonia sp. MUSA4]